jgi:cytochrome c oxidase subunit 4
MADHEHHTDNAHAPHGVGHIVSPKILIATALGLLVLTGLTVASVQIDFEQFDLREMNIVIALTIAVIKASLVCLFFMHLRWDRPFNAFVLVGSLGLVALFIAFAMTDSAEYQPEIIRGDSTTVQSKLLQLSTAEPPATHERTTAAGAPTAGH